MSDLSTRLEPPAGWYIREREDNELLIDMDSKSVPGDWMVRLEKVEAIHSISKVVQYRSKSGNIHLIVTLDVSIDDIEAMFLQLYLGSDPVREILSLNRAYSTDIKPSVLYMKIEDEGETIYG